MNALRKIRSRAPREDRATVRFNATADQTWALDSDFLYKRLDELRPYGRHYVNRIYMLDLIADMLLLLSVLSTFFIAWWSGLPLLLLACIQRQANRRMAGELAAKAAKESTDAFIYLYNRGALWLD